MRAVDYVGTQVEERFEAGVGGELAFRCLLASHGVSAGGSYQRARNSV
jgi:hypothetical protein